MNTLKITPFLLAIALVSAQPSTAQAWSGDTHEEMARQSILYMLRSSNPTLRFVGMILMAGGEGSKASPTGQRNWPLSFEAKNVDNYNDILLKNTGDTPFGDELGAVGEDSNLFHEFQGHNFTAYNHFLLYRDGVTSGPTPAAAPLYDDPIEGSSGWSHDKYYVRCRDLIYDANLNALRERRADEEDNSQECIESCGANGDGVVDVGERNLNPCTVDQCVESDPVVSTGAGRLYSCNEVSPSADGHIWMGMHDNYAGYSVAVDSSVGGDITAGGFPTQGQLLRMAGTHSELQDFCGDLFEGAVNDFEVGFESIPILGGFIDSVVERIPIVSYADDLVVAALKKVVIFAAKDYLASMCPSVEGYWPEPRTGFAYRNAMALYANNSSTFAQRDYDKISMIDVRWHPVDNLISYGKNQFAGALLARTNTTTATYNAVSDGEGTTGTNTTTATGDYLSTDDTNVALDSEGGGSYGTPTENTVVVGDQYNADPNSVPLSSHIGNLRELGRVLHGMSDLAVPGHVTGNLLGGEHIIIEDVANKFINGFSSYLAEPEEASETGAIQSSPHEVGATIFALDGLVDMDSAGDKLEEILFVDSFDTLSLEKHSENAAQATRNAYREDILLGAFDVDPVNGEQTLINPRLTRAYLTRALINNIVGAVYSMKRYYKLYTSRPWDDIVSEISWTEADASLISQSLRAGTFPSNINMFPPPSFYNVVVDESTNFNLNIDHNYQEFQQTSGCYVATHEWCNPDTSDLDAWRPCLSKCTEGRGNCYECLGDDCQNTGPTFISELDLGAQVTLSSANRGRIGDEIHVTGLHEEGETQIEHFRGDLTESAGQAITLPAGSIADGFALWCTGSDIGREVFVDDATGETFGDVSCEIEEISPNAFACDRMERYIWAGGKTPPPSYEAVPLLPQKDGSLSTATIEDLAKRFETSPKELAEALSSAEGKIIDLITPSPWGVASFVWVDDKRYTNIVTIDYYGSIWTKRSTDPINLESKVDGR